MNRFIFDEYYQDPALRRQLFNMARDERSRAVRAGFAWLAKQLHLSPSQRRSAS
ncbi:MAG: hypothetical protein ACRET8_01465 [Burkholderiales bacterium]